MGPVALVAPVAVIPLILAGAWRAADGLAEPAFWKSAAEPIGFRPFRDLGELELTTPLLHAGDRRSLRHELAGPLGELGLPRPPRALPLRRAPRGQGRRGDLDEHRFTVCVVELEAGMGLFPGIYLRARRGLRGIGRPDWLRGPRGCAGRARERRLRRGLRAARARRSRTTAAVRELFDPKTIVWLAEHPLRPHFEFRAGFLVVYVPGHLEDLGRVVWLLEAAERLAGRVGRRSPGAVGVGSAPCASASSPLASSSLALLLAARGAGPDPAAAEVRPRRAGPVDRRRQRAAQARPGPPPLAARRHPQLPLPDRAPLLLRRAAVRS